VQKIYLLQNFGIFITYFCAAEEFFKIFFCHNILCCRRISEDFFLGVRTNSRSRPSFSGLRIIYYTMLLLYKVGLSNQFPQPHERKVHALPRNRTQHFWGSRGLRRPFRPQYVAIQESQPKHSAVAKADGSSQLAVRRTCDRILENFNKFTSILLMKICFFKKIVELKLTMIHF
jgi:hypothetical protein